MQVGDWGWRPKRRARILRALRMIGRALLQNYAAVAALLFMTLLLVGFGAALWELPAAEALAILVLIALFWTKPLRR